MIESAYVDESTQPPLPDSVKLNEKLQAMDQECRYERVFDEIDVAITRTDRGYTFSLIMSINDDSGKIFERIVFQYNSVIAPWTSQKHTQSISKQITGLSELKDRSEAWVNSKLTSLFDVLREESESEDNNISWLLASPAVKEVLSRVTSATAWPSSNPNTATYDIVFKDSEGFYQTLEMPLIEWISISPTPFIKRYVCVYPLENCPIKTKGEWEELKSRLYEIMGCQERETFDPIDDAFLQIRDHVNCRALWTIDISECAKARNYVYCEETFKNGWLLYVQSRFVEQALGERTFEKYSSRLSKGLRGQDEDSPLALVKRTWVNRNRIRFWVFKGEKFGFDPEKIAFSQEGADRVGDSQ